MRLHLPTPEATHALGRRLGALVLPGAVLALVGDLGAGKTALVQGLAAGLGAPGRVQSPTFVLVQPHEGGRLALWHADWYRLRSEAEAEALGLFEVALGGVVAIEWADRFPELLPDERLDIVLTDEGVGRDVEVIGRGAAHRAIEAGLEATLG